MKKCPIHKFGATYEAIGDGWYQCNKCKAFFHTNDCSEKTIRISKLFIR